MKRTIVFLLLLAMCISLYACSQKGTLALKYGEIATISLSKAYDELEWESSNNEVATVLNGDVTATGPGQASIIAKSNDSVVAQYDVSVSIVDISNVFLSSDSIELKIEESTTLTYSLFPQDASDYGLTYTSINPDIATVDENGVIHGICSGKTNIVVSTESGATATCEVIVTDLSAIEQLNEYESRFFDVLVKEVLPSFYNAPAARIKKLGLALGKEQTDGNLWLEVEIQGTNRLGGTLFKDYAILCLSDGTSVCIPCVTSDGLLPEPHEWYECTKIDVDKINLALKEYWENAGMAN